MFKVKKPAPDARILRLRDYEDKLRSMQEKVADQAAMSRVATWEDNTNQKIVTNNVMRAYDALRAQRAADLDARRERLAQKLFAEESALQQELLDSRETPEQKRAQLAARAKALWESREAERQATAQNLLEKHFRENSDILRQEFSKKKAMYTLDVRERQIEDNTLRRLNELKERTQWDECEQFEDLKNTMRSLGDAQKRVDDMHMMERKLDEQLRDKLKRINAEKASEQAELDAVSAFQRRKGDEEVAREAARKAEAQALSDDIKRFNESKIVSDRIKAQQQLEADRVWMKDFLARERKQVQAEQVLKDRQRAEMRRWKEALEQASRAEELDEREAEALITKYEAEQWARYDMEQKKIDDARAALNAEVQGTRAQQIREKRERAQYALQEDIAERSRMLEEDVAMADLEAAYKARMHKEALGQRLDVQAKAMYQEQKKKVEQAEKARALDELKNAEANYQARVKEASNFAPPVYFGRPKVDWFY